MKYSVGVVALLMFAYVTCPSLLWADMNVDSFEIQFQVRETQRRAIIARAMKFTPKESAAFWKKYDGYRLLVKDFQHQRQEMLNEVSTSMIGMTDKTARNVVSAALKLEEAQQKAKSRFLRSLRPMLVKAKYFRIYQLETKLDAMFTHGWTKGIPLAVTKEEAAILQQNMADRKIREGAKIDQPSTEI